MKTGAKYVVREIAGLKESIKEMAGLKQILRDRQDRRMG